jgi:hypothetical protein
MVDKSWKTLFILLLLQTCCVRKNLDVEPVKTDACTAWPDGNYAVCCQKHDAAYFNGGSWKDRLNADNELWRCVEEKTKSPIFAGIMWLGSRLFGVSWIPTPFRWGNRWKFPQSGPSEDEIEKNPDSLKVPDFEEKVRTGESETKRPNESVDPKKPDKERIQSLTTNS